MDMMLTPATNIPLGDGVAPDPGRCRDTFPYFGSGYTGAEQATVPIRAALAADDGG